MKIVCTNTDYCGKTETIESDTQEPQPLATVCNFCGSLALYYSDKYEPIFKKEYTSLEIENLFIKMYLKILNKTRKTDDNNK